MKPSSHRVALAVGAVVALGCSGTGHDGPVAVTAEPSTTSCSARTFGNPVAGTFWNTASADRKRVNAFISPGANATVTKLTAYVDGLGATSGTMSVQGIVYAADGTNGAPSTLLCTTSSFTVSAGMPATWQDLPVSGSCVLAKPGAYYLGLLTGGTAGLMRYSSTNLAGALQVNDNLAANGPSNPFGAASPADLVMSIYASVASSGTDAGTGGDASADSGPADTGHPDTGSPADTGTPITCTVTLSPGAAVDTAFNALSPGDVLCLQTGTYGGPSSNIHLAKSGTAGHPITLTTAPGQPPATIEGAFQIGVNDATGHQSYVTVSHLTFDLDYLIGRVNGTSAGCTANSVFGVQLNGGNLTFEYNEVYETGVSPEYRDTAVGVDFQQGLVEPNIVIRNNKIHDYGACDHFDHGIYLDFISSGDISGNWIWNPGCSYGMGGGDHSKGCGAGIQLWVAPTGLAVHGNVIDGTGIGFYYSGSNNSVYDNVITNLRGMYTQTGSVETAAAYGGYGGSASNTFHDNDFLNAGPLCNDCTATSSNNVSVDPMYVDPASHNYALLPGSPVASYGLWDGTGR